MLRCGSSQTTIERARGLRRSASLLDAHVSVMPGQPVLRATARRTTFASDSMTPACQRQSPRCYSNRTMDLRLNSYGIGAAKMNEVIPFAQRFSCTITEACEATGLGRTKLYELIGAGAIETTIVGRRRLVL